jgi:hypothetical protein
MICGMRLKRFAWAYTSEHTSEYLSTCRMCPYLAVTTTNPPRMVDTGCLRRLNTAQAGGGKGVRRGSEKGKSWRAGGLECT